MWQRLVLSAGVQSAGSGVDVLDDYGCPTLEVVDKFDDRYWEHTTGSTRLLGAQDWRRGLQS